MDIMKLPIVVPSGFRIIAHRGASGYAPENTLSAFLLAERMGATEVELDVRFSKDKRLVICHDETLDRFGYPGVKVADLTARDLLASTWDRHSHPTFIAVRGYCSLIPCFTYSASDLHITWR